MQKVITKELDLNGKKLILQTGKLALQADAAVMATMAFASGWPFAVLRVMLSVMAGAFIS